MRRLRGGRLLVHLGRHAVRGEHDDRALGHLVVLLDEDRAAGLERRARRAGCARSACGRRPARRSGRAPARRSAPRGRRRRSSRAAWPAAPACRGRLPRVAAVRSCLSMVRIAAMRQAGCMPAAVTRPRRPRSGRHRRWTRPSTCPDTAIELPMLAVSTALQAVAAGPAALRRAGRARRRGAQPPRPTDEPPSWATLRRPPGRRAPTLDPAGSGPDVRRRHGARRDPARRRTPRSPPPPARPPQAPPRRPQAVRARALRAVGVRHRRRPCGRRTRPVARLETSAESPVPVRVVAMKIGEWIARLGEVWIDGPDRPAHPPPGRGDPVPDPARPGRQHLAHRHLPARDPARRDRRGHPGGAAGPSRLLARARARSACAPPRSARSASASCWPASKRCKPLLAAEGLFAAERKRRLPFLPRQIGLITGRASAAERDVVENARRRLPGRRFRIENVATQGAVRGQRDHRGAASAWTPTPTVDVIVIARGGGSVEDLLPFSNESPGAGGVRRAHAGGQRDRPRDRRAAARPRRRPRRVHADRRGKRIVPDLADELRAVAELRHRGPRQHPPPPRARGRADGRPARAACGARCAPGSTRERERRPSAARPRPPPAARRCSRPPTPTSSTSARGCAPCRRRPPSIAATRSCAAPTARWSATPAEARRRLRIRVAGGEFDVAVTDGR